MALTKTQKVDKIEVIGDFKMVQVRTATVIEEDGVELSRNFHRHVVSAGYLNEDGVWTDADISGETQEVQDVCNAVHTQAVKDAYAAHLAAQASEMTPSEE